MGKYRFEIDTSNVSFVFLGSFDSMVKAKEDAVNASHTIGFGVKGQDETFDGYKTVSLHRKTSSHMQMSEARSPAV